MQKKIPYDYMIVVSVLINRTWFATEMSFQ